MIERSSPVKSGALLAEEADQQDVCCVIMMNMSRTCDVSEESIVM